jgi:hypothetical protein
LIRTGEVIGARSKTDDTIFVGEIGFRPAPKEQPPRKLSGKRTTQMTKLWKEALSRPPKG